jgi:hypothetical protein
LVSFLLKLDQKLEFYFLKVEELPLVVELVQDQQLQEGPLVEEPVVELELPLEELLEEPEVELEQPLEELLERELLIEVAAVPLEELTNESQEPLVGSNEIGILECSLFLLLGTRRCQLF